MADKVKPQAKADPYQPVGDSIVADQIRDDQLTLLLSLVKGLLRRLPPADAVQLLNDAEQALRAELTAQQVDGPGADVAVADAMAPLR